MRKSQQIFVDLIFRYFKSQPLRVFLFSASFFRWIMTDFAPSDEEIRFGGPMSKLDDDEVDEDEEDVS